MTYYAAPAYYAEIAPLRRFAAHMRAAFFSLLLLMLICHATLKAID